ncbi:MAG: formate/nitrite transporter family protein, partial [Gemmatimonadota bacterium]|nr:formate/nitrite transporter family protein [Gemmatimonadota bacterium]
AGGRAVKDLFATDEIFHRVIATAGEEFGRSTRQLFSSGLAAGLSMSLSFIGAAALRSQVEGPGGHLIGSTLYPLGFLIVVMGRYQLFTENTLTPVTLVLTRMASIPLLLRVWSVVFAANVIGAAIAAGFLATTGVFSDATARVGVEMGLDLVAFGWSALFFKGIIAGWLVATIVWLTHAVREAAGRILAVWIIVYTIAVAKLAHCIAGACEVLFAVFLGEITWTEFAWGFLTPTTLGNVVGGVLVVALLNYAQAARELTPGSDYMGPRLSWREWALGRRLSRPD